jgi:hypothetical protein
MGSIGCNETSITTDKRSVNTPELPRLAISLIYRNLLKGNMPTEVLPQLTKDSENNNTNPYLRAKFCFLVAKTNNNGLQIVN